MKFALLHIMSVLIIVGYMMHTLYYSTLDHPIEVDPAIGDGYSGELADTNVQDCSMNYTAGRLRPTVFYSFYLTNLQFLIVLPSKRVT